MPYTNNTNLDEDLKDWFSTIIVSAEVCMYYNLPVQKDDSIYLCTYEDVFNALLKLENHDKMVAMFFVEADLRKNKEVARKDLETLGYLYVKEFKNEKN